MKAALRLLPMVLLAAVVADCSANRGHKEAFCPGSVVLADVARQPMFRQGAAADPSNIVYTMEIVGVEGSCDYDKKGRDADASVDVHFRATRAPTGEQAVYNVPYFVAVTQADRIINRQNFTVQIAFAPGASVAEATDTVPDTHIHTEQDKKPYDYQLVVGLPLTKQQLDYNRTMGRYAQ
ncbi:MAG TPA: hypothetical protein VGF56_11750 [Rhizomicrobium sp.]